MKDVNLAAVTPPDPAAGHKPSCLLCGSPGVFSSLYFPGKATPAGPPPGKGRIILYSLCEYCGTHRDKLTEIIEARIESELRTAGVI